MPLSDLSDEQQAAFKARLKEMNLTEADVVPRLGPDTQKGPTILSADPRESAVRPHMFTFNDLDQMKALVGNPDSDYETGFMDLHHELVNHWPQDRNGDCEDDLTPADNQRIDHAYKAYLFSHSKYFASYKAIVEKIHFPAKFVVFAVVDVCLDSTNSPLVVKNGSGVNFGTITICEGGWIDFQADAVVTIQKMVKTDAPSCP